MAGESDLTRETDVDLAGIFTSLWTHKGKLLLASLIATVIAFVVLQFVEPRYRTEARILIRAGENILAGPVGTGANPSNDFDDPGIASQVQLLQSRDIARRIIADESLGLMNRSEFETGKNASLLSLIGIGGGGSAQGAEDRVLESYYKRLKVFQADRARVIVVQFWSSDKELAAAIPNRITEEYLKLQEELKRGIAPEELASLEPELEEQRRLVQEAEARVSDYRTQSDLAQGRDDDSLATQELSELATELGRVRAQLSQAEANADAVERALVSGRLESASQVLSSPLVQRLQERLGSLESDLAEQSTTLLSGHPRIQRLQSQISTLQQQISREARKIQRSLAEEAAVGRARERDLLQRRNQLKSEAGRVDRANVELRALEREADAQRQILNTYLLRFKEATSRQDREFLPADAFVFSKAQVKSAPYFPKKGPILGGVFFGTFLIGALVTMAANILSGTAVRTQAEAQEAEEAPVAKEKVIPPQPQPAPQRQHVPAASAASLAPDIAAFTPMHDASVTTDAAAQSIASLGQARVVALSPSGAESAEGTLELARAIYATGRGVVLVDVSGTDALSARIFRPGERAGLRNVLSGTAGFAAALHSDPATGLHIMPSGTNDGAAGGALKLPSVLSALEQTYDCILIECGSAGVKALRQVVNDETVCIVNSTRAGDPRVAGVTTDMQRAGYQAPLEVRMDVSEDFAQYA